MAALTCGLVGATRNAASITGTRGRIDLPPVFFAPQSFTLHRADTAEVFEFPFEGRGYQFEAEEVQRCLRSGAPESPLMPHETTLEVMALMDTVRNEVGVVYPPVS
jgi:predicted dehydrogenase